MKKSEACLLALLLVLIGCGKGKDAEAQADTAWRLLGPRHTHQALHAVWTGPAGEVVAVGAAGTILLSRDQGKSWERVARSSPSTLLDVSGTKDVIIAVGEGGALLRSLDKGKTWEAKSSASLTSLKSVFALGQDLFAVGAAGTILHSPDLGATWEEQKSGTRQALREVFGGSPDNIRVHGEGGVVLVSKDRGKTWRNPEGGPTLQNGSRLTCVTEGGDNVWYALEGDAVYASEDGGSSWELFYQGPEVQCVVGQRGHLLGFGPESLHYQEGEDPWQDVDMSALGKIPAILSLAKVSDSVWVAVGEGGLILRSEDKGKTWENVSGAVEVALADLWESPTGALYAVGAEGTVLYAPKKNAPFVVSRAKTPFPQKTTLFDILAGPDAIHLVGDQGGFTSRDKGASFTPWSGCQDSLLRAVFELEGALYAVGKKAPDPTSEATVGVVCRSRDQGETWDQNTLADQDLKDIWGSGASLFALGTSQILRSRDGGATWAVVADNPDLGLRALAGSGALLFAAGEGGGFLRSKDGGETWEQKPAPQGIKDVFVASEKEIFLVGPDTLLRSEDGGETWTPSLGVYGSLTRVYAKGASVRAVSEEGRLWSSEDSGASFQLTRSAVGEVALYGLAQNPSGTLYAVGAYSTILVSEKAGEPPWVRSTDAKFDLIAVSGASDKDIYALDKEGGILHSQDGKHFVLARFYTRAKLNDLHAGEAGVFLVGEEGTLLRVEDQGLRLTPAKPAAKDRFSQKLFAVWSAPPSYVFAVGEGGTLVTSVDGGKTFSVREEREALTDFVDLVGVSPDEFYAVGGNVIYRFSEKGKKSSSFQAKPPFFDLYRVAREGPLVMALDRTGALLRYNVEGKSADEEKNLPQDKLSVMRSGKSGRVYALGKNGAVWARGR